MWFSRCFTCVFIIFAWGYDNSLSTPTTTATMTMTTTLAARYPSNFCFTHNVWTQKNVFFFLVVVFLSIFFWMHSLRATNIHTPIAVTAVWCTVCVRAYILSLALFGFFASYFYFEFFFFSYYFLLPRFVCSYCEFQVLSAFYSLSSFCCSLFRWVNIYFFLRLAACCVFSFLIFFLCFVELLLLLYMVLNAGAFSSFSLFLICVQFLTSVHMCCYFCTFIPFSRLFCCRCWRVVYTDAVVVSLDTYMLLFIFRCCLFCWFHVNYLLFVYYLILIRFVVFADFRLIFRMLFVRHNKLLRFFTSH